MKEANKTEKTRSSPTQKETSVTDACGHNLERSRQGNLIVVTGPSGVGKGTMTAALLCDVSGVSKSVSVTTRKLREGEEDSVDYFFRTASQFEEMRKKGEFLEWAEFTGNLYGTPASWVKDQLGKGTDVLLEIEVQGAKQVRKKVEDAILIFISPPSLDELEKRLRLRATETDDSIARRLAKAREELDERALFDYEVINDNLTRAVLDLSNIVYAERLRIR
jgi:guanylate kinase